VAAKSQPIIVIKRNGGHGGHHGGAWKVAYADFVTAMMSLFIVLWLMNSSVKIKKAVAGYFNDPKGTASMMGTTMSGTGETVTAAAGDDMQKLKDKIEEQIKAKKDLEKLSKQIAITITAEGLRIELLEDKNGTFYQSGSARLSESGQELLALLAGELKTLPNSLLIEGHTDAILQRQELRQLGAVGGPGELCAQAPAAGRSTVRPGDAGAWIRRSAATCKRQSIRSVEPSSLHPGEEPERSAAGLEGCCRWLKC
jgi:hypothetical protein